MRKIPVGDLPKSQESLLRARFAMAQSKWEDARSLLGTALKESPDNRQLHIQMAKVCEHFQAWQEAAEHYREANNIR